LPDWAVQANKIHTPDYAKDASAVILYDEYVETIDANGRVVYSDQPPSAASVKAETLAAPAPAANPNAAKELAQKDADLRKRATERTEAAAKAEKDRTAKEQRAEECTRMANTIKQLSSTQFTIYRANDKGEQEEMDAAAKQRERARLEGLQKEHCA